ncbi:MAG: hypothetical protein LBE31_01595 [Deltaproteobacteria bacterium]|jgi:hypothetical protein|nr:hypothetical protein [Deltaproteobacteria bacterium]
MNNSKSELIFACIFFAIIFIGIIISQIYGPSQSNGDDKAQSEASSSVGSSSAALTSPASSSEAPSIVTASSANPSLEPALNSVSAAPNGDLNVPLAVDYIENSLKEYDNVLYIYRDYVDGANNYTQKAWMGNNYKNIPEMNEAAEGRDGTTGILAELDLTNHSWGGYLFINGLLQAGSTLPELDFGDNKTGLDLTGATKLVFYARGEKGGESVSFFLGGLGMEMGKKSAPHADSAPQVSLGYVTLKDSWERYEIPLSHLNRDLISIACGFGWVTNDVSNSDSKLVRFYLDDIYFEFAEPKLRPMFLTSYAPAPAGTDGAIINNAAYLYDNALAVMALSYAGKHQRARQIADAIVYALDHDRFFTDGRLRNAYMSGNPQSYPGWFSSRGEEFARLPSFYDPKAKKSFEDSNMVGTTTGNCAWAILALMEVYANNPQEKQYLQAAQKIADFILTLQSGQGFLGGYEDWEPKPKKISYKSVEHNTDLITAFGRLAKLTSNDVYQKASKSAEAFVLSMYDDKRGLFYTGTKTDGRTINKAVIPLDCQTWTLLALKDAPVDSQKIVSYIEAHMSVDGGYDFEADSKDGVWNEGTAQVGVLYQKLNQKPEATRILNYLTEHKLPDGSLTAADRDGVTTGFLVSGTDLPWKYDRRKHLGATAWLSFLEQNRNPLSY